MVIGGKRGKKKSSLNNRCYRFPPSTAAWKDAPSMLSPKSSFHTLLLPSGEIFVVGANSQGKCEMLERGGVLAASRPTIYSVGGQTSFPISIRPGSSFLITGTGFRGVSEGSSGLNGFNSSTNFPLVSLARVSTIGSESSGNPGSGSVFGRTTDWLSGRSLICALPAESLPEGDYFLQVIVNGVASSPKTVRISASAPDAPILSVNPSTLVFSAPFVDPSANRKSVLLKNTGLGMSRWNASDDATWMTVLPSVGGLQSGSAQSMDVIVDVTGLAYGTHNGTITISDPAIGNAVRVPVTLYVNSTLAPVVVVAPMGLSFTATAGGPNPPAQPIVLTNGGSTTLNWVATDNAAWLSMPVSSDTVASGSSQVVSVQVDISGMTAGSYSAVILVSAPGASNGPQPVGVQLTITP